MDGIVIYETCFPNNINENALPLSKLEFEINPDLTNEKWSLIQIIEKWEPDEIEEERGRLSWSQFAIERCNHFSK